MSTNKVNSGAVIRHTAAVAISSGDVVVVGQILGVAIVDIAIGATGAVAISGRYTVPKVSAAVIEQGESLVYDVSAGEFDDNAATPATGDVSGPPAVAAQSYAATTTSMDIVLTGVPGTVT